MRGNILLIFLQIVFIFVRVTLGQLLTSILPPDPTYLQIYALPVGQGDCTIIQCPGSGAIIVLDCGSCGGNNGNHFKEIEVQSFLGGQINQVKYIIVSHPDMDHFAYLDQISWNSSSVMAVVLGGKLSDYAPISTWVNAWNDMNKLYTVNNQLNCIASGSTICAATNVKAGTSLTMDFCSNSLIGFEILAANVGSTKNQMSIVLRVSHDQGARGWSILFSGDMEGGASSTIAKALGSKLKSIVYKFAHHGASSRANRNNWLQPIEPQYAFVSNAYQYKNCRHPRCDAINRLLSYHTIIMGPLHQFYCSDQKGMAMIDTSYQLNIFETTIDSKTICVLVYTSASPFVNSIVHCGAVSVSTGFSTNSSVDGEDFVDECAGSGDGTLTTIVNVTMMIIMLLLSVL